MKKYSHYAIIFIMFVTISACGGSKQTADTTWDGTDTATDITTSIEAIGTVMNYASLIIDQCFNVSPGTIRCDCPNGGTITLIEGANDSGSFNFDDCVDGNGQLFNGEMAYNGDETTFNFTRAAVCRDLKNTANSADCTGLLEGTCNNNYTSCSFQRIDGQCKCM